KLVMRRSIDNGVTWSPTSDIYVEADRNAHQIKIGSPVVDAATGQIFFLFSRDTSQVLVIDSTDDGLTWSAPKDITSSVKVLGPGTPPGSTFPSTPWGWYAIGPGHGIQIQHGPHAGRLVIPADHKLVASSGDPSVWS